MSSSVSAPVVRRPRDPVSDDEAKEKRKEQNRQAQARARAKKKESMSAGAKPASLQSIPKKPTMSEEEAKNIINRAVQVDKAKREVNLLKYGRLKKEMVDKAKSYLNATPEVVIKDGKIDYVLIDPDFKTFKKYVSESYPKVLEVLEIIKKYHGRTINENRDADKIYLKYKPYADYDSFTFSYPRGDGSTASTTDFSFKIDYNADTRYGVYLYNQYWRYNYYRHQESLGTLKNIGSGSKISIIERYPEIELEQNTDTIDSVPENKLKIASKYLHDLYGFYKGEEWYRKKTDAYYAPMYKKTIISLGEPDPPSPKAKTQSASANLGGSPTMTGIKSGRITKSAKARLQNTSSASATSTISARSDSSSYF